MEEESSDLENEHKTVHYDELPDGYAEDLYSNDSKTDNYAYQERPESFRAMKLDGSDDSDLATSSDEESITNNLYELSSDCLEVRTPRSTVLPIYEAEIGGIL